MASRCPHELHVFEPFSPGGSCPETLARTLPPTRQLLEHALPARQSPFATGSTAVTRHRPAIGSARQASTRPLS